MFNKGIPVCPIPCRRPFVICCKPIRNVANAKTRIAGPAAAVLYKSSEIGAAKTANPKQAGTVMMLAIRIAVLVRLSTSLNLPAVKAAETAGTRLVAKDTVKRVGT